MPVILDIDRRIEVADKMYLTATDIVERNFWRERRNELVNIYSRFPQYRGKDSEHI